MALTAASSSLKSSLSRLLISSSKMAHALAWNQAAAAGSILTLNILRDRIDIAVASHPTSVDASIQTLPSIPIKTETVNSRRALSPAVAKELKSLMDSWHVCGLVVHWPVQKDGWCGAPCGRVLFTLDQLASSIGRPVCLWDEEHASPDEDEWGRTPVYARQTTGKDVHVASQEQYKAPNVAVTEIWNDFCRANWPELYYNLPSAAASSRPSLARDSSWLGSAAY